MASILKEGSGKLGFGYMRLPLRDGHFDSESVNLMVDKFLGCGFTYFDTAFIYEGSEDALRDSLVSRHPRDKFSITTKLPLMMVPDVKTMREMLDKSLARLGTDHVDTYFLHGLDGGGAKRGEEIGAWDFLKGLIKEGKARHIGFSYHGTPEDLDIILSEHPEVELVQLQLNYLDWESESVRSKDLYYAARKHNIPISVMEPCKGGLLSSADSEAGKLLTAARSDLSTSSWAFRFLLGLPGIEVILSGMGEMYQLEDNAKTFIEYEPLSEDEQNLIRKAVDLINATPRIPCTSCRYCVSHCNQKIYIPQYIKLYNDFLAHRDKDAVGYQYAQTAGMGGAKPSDCIACRACEEHCPQHIEISDVLKKLIDEAEIEVYKEKYKPA